FLLHGWKDRVTEFSIIIYNRWGEKVFESNDPERAWDGTYNGKLVDVGVFAYYIDATLNNGEKTIKKGNISLIR
ncbi:MAG: gliding motility-associated C-terminal domain-containing protein, partial [Bacteroidia bacterium]